MIAINKNIAQISQFGIDVRSGLQQTPKQLSSKYFYDAKGDQLFQDIMHMPEYYLTNCEFEILESSKKALLDLIGTAHFDLIELGAGDGHKTKILLEHFSKAQADFSYIPVDISANVLQHLKGDLLKRWPSMDVIPMQGDYLAMLEELHYRHTARKVILFMGANIGNLTPQRAKAFLSRIKAHMEPGDILIIGFDLKKDPATILNAYNDPAGITAAFNLNLLSRMNRELGANFELNSFKHWESYDPITGATKSFLISKKEQEVYIKYLKETFTFKAWEAIEVELSQKYSISEIQDLASELNFKVLEHFKDARDYFVDSVWLK